MIGGIELKYKTGEEFLNKLYFNMHMSEEVMHNASKSDSPEQKISKYIKIFLRLITL